MATYLVTCATGKQGAATVKHLLAAGAKVHAVVRDPEKDTAQALKKQGVVLFQGDNENYDVFREAAKGCKGLFLVPLPFNKEAEVRQARVVVQASIEAGVETVVVSTAFWTGDREKWDDEENKKEGLAVYYESKAAVESEVRQPSLKSWTILRPGWFHTNYLLPETDLYYPGMREKGELMHSLNEGVAIAHIDVDDIGKFAAAALLDPEKFGGHEIELGCQNLTPEDTAKALSKASGREVKARKRTPEEVVEAAKKVGVQRFQLWANRQFLELDGQALQDKYGIRLTTFEEYLEREKDVVLATLSPTTRDQ
ncbi:uncharacterized protein JN550_001830 [Neoarthrinium moseri]|uniref:uncharacterized protein n=1 Tax=Neoarthrinium moseri TaxID=1658444 RepID=UPI001FDCE19C|nr:uncharacterized protein JN550_001830 [Neoarthrinium moseri]KAI1875544.1 hypothetical protein JN550_001830 [Neoarthrinium moseri]